MDRTATIVRKLRSLELRRVDGPAPGPPRTFTLPRVTVGRSKACDVVVSHSSVSALHCELRVRSEYVELRDLESTNGLHLDGRRIFHVELRPGDCFDVGEVTFELLEAGEVDVPVSADDRFEEMLGCSPVIREVFAQFDGLATTTIDVLIAGETGTGKEVAARSLHLRSGRAGPFTVVDCDSLTAQALDYAFEDTNGGTLMLDDIAELPLELQPRLLRLLDRRGSRRQPDDPRQALDVRIVAATRTDLLQLVATKRFRENLYFRVAQALVELPPLRERGDDVELLAAQFLAEQASLVVGLELGEEARLALHEHRWLGNVRELRNVIQRAVHLAQGPRLHAHDLALRGLGGLDSHCGQYGQGSLMSTEELLTLPYREAHDQLDHDYLRRIMLETGGNITHAAQRLGTSRRSLRERLKRLGLYTGETSHALRFTTSQAARRSSTSRLAATGSR